MKDLRFAKFVVIVNAAVPLALLGWGAWNHRLGANPINYAILTTGMLTLVFLCLSLLVTPLRRITGFSWLFHFRRTLGLFAFFYGLCHFLLYFGMDQSFNIPKTFASMLKTRYLLVGSGALLILTALAATSFNRTIKRLGPKRWQALHKLVYVAAGLGVLHYYMQAKADVRLPLTFAAVVAILLLFRMAWAATHTSRGAGAVMPGGWKGALKVAAIEAQTPDVSTFRLTPTRGGKLPFSYQPGQHLTLELPIDAKLVRRSYTIASSPTKAGCCELTIKRESMGAGSRHMHERIRVGDRVHVTAPGGSFVFTGGAGNAVALLGGGVGITPLMSIVRYLTDNAWFGQIYLLFSNKTEADIVFRRELDSLAARFPNLHVTYTLTRATPETWTGRRGRIDAAMIAEIIPDAIRTPFYICGPSPMIEAAKQDLRSLGVPEEFIHSESFGGLAGAAATAETFNVTFAKSRKTGPATPGRSLLEVAESLGITVDYECRSGICGRCACKLVSGAVVMAVQDALTAPDRAAGKVLLCQAQATSDVEVAA